MTLLYLDTSYTENLFVSDTSLKSWALGTTNNWYPVSGDWALSGTSNSYTSADPYWSIDILAWTITNGYLPSGSYYGTNSIYTNTFQL